jgi:small-conductance mechanosensitive channel
MDIQPILLSIREALRFELFTVAKVKVTPGTLLIFIVIILGTRLTSKIVTRTIGRFFKQKASDIQSNGEIIQRITHYTIMLAGLVAALQTIGIDLSTLFAAGALFAVGLGFAMQNISQNFVSGIILLVERSIKPGDVIEVEQRVVKVIRTGIRSTLVRTRNEEELIVPNSMLVQSVVKNYTLTNSSYLIGTVVGVVYGSDMKKVREILTRTAKSIPWRDKSGEPRILMKEFADSSVNFEVFVWTHEPWIARRLKSELNEAIWWALKEAGIVIAFPQLDVHFDPDVEETLRLAASKK